MIATSVNTSRNGVAYVIAIMVMAILVTIAAAFAAFSNLGAQTSKNVADVHRARLAAESGLSFAIAQIRVIPLPSDTDDDTVIANIAAALGERLDASSNLAGATVTFSANTVHVPRITMDDGAFEIFIIQQPDKTLTLEAHGFVNDVERVAAIDLLLRPGHPNSVFNYGLASRGPITITGDGEIRGKNELTEASVISTTEADVAVTIDGSVVVDGDISSTGETTSVVISGTPTIAGSTDPAVIADHIHFAVDPPVFPEVDTSIFRPLAINIVDGTTNTGQAGQVFENILITAGTNPTFAADTIINGVVYIESPNIVNFSAKVTLNGVIATEDNDLDLESCKIHFGAQVEAYGVEALPDLPQFADVRDLTGSLVVAPGFDVSFAGHFSTISGTIAADKLSFSGQAEGTVMGSVVGLADYPTWISGTVNIVIDQSGQDSNDAGFTMPLCLEVDPKTYRESTSQ